MRSLGILLPILAVAASAGIGSSALATGFGYGETVYATPVATTYAWPTSYRTYSSYVVPTTYSHPSYIPTSYGYSSYVPTYYSTSSYVPTSYVYPSYLPTSYAYEPLTLAPTTYLTTGYTYRRGLFGRLRLVERPVIASYATSYVPTTYFSPTVYTTSYRTTSYVPTVYSPVTYEYPTVWQTSYASSRGWDDCDQVVWSSPAVTSPSRSSTSPSSRNDSASPSGGGSGTTASESAAESVIPSTVGPAPSEPSLASPASEISRVPAGAERADSPPAVPAAPRQQNTAQPTAKNQDNAGAAQKSAPRTPAAPKAAPPTAPSTDPTVPEIVPAPIENPGATTRESLRPTYATRQNRPEFRNVLVGRVESEAGEPLSEVPVSATSRDNSSIRRGGTTDAFGNFAIRLADGEWTVNVRTPSGRTYAVRSVTVTNGKVMDNREGREVRNLIISY
jgi:hypothetical protein